MPPEQKLEPYRHDYTPLPAQLEAHNCAARYLLFGGAVGPGKSRFLCEWAFAKMVRWPGIPIFIGREHLKDIAMTTEKTWVRNIDNRLWDDPRYGGGKSGHRYTIGNGSSVEFIGARDWESLMSAEIGALGFDEMSELEEVVYNNLDTRLRWMPGSTEPCSGRNCDLEGSHPEHPLFQIAGCTNPCGGWIKERWFDRWQKGRLPRDHAFIQSITKDNPYLPAGYVDTLSANGNASWVRRMIAGDWTAFEGQIFKNYDEAIHLWPMTDPIHHLAVEYIGGIDVGATTQYAHRTVGLVAAVLRSLDIVVFAEYSEQGPASETFERWVGEMRERYGVVRWRGSPEQDRYLRMLGASVDANIRPAQKEGGSRVARTNRTYNAFERALDTGRPRLYIHENCGHTRTGIQAYTQIPPEKALSGVARPSDEALRRDDDEVDALGYLLEEVAQSYVLEENREIVTPMIAAAPFAHSSIITRRRDARHARLKRILEGWGEN